ncbi:YybH family protein [Micromonospora sp. URMC 105]|uniref:YybH family protein n=1 Tax=Micromonospora sp. URMC 105 TaxID=3423413 RepID=UPI003F1DAECE
MTTTEPVDVYQLVLTDDVEQQNEAFVQAFNSGDGAAFDRLYLDDAISNLSGGPLTGEQRRAAIIEILAKRPQLKARVLRNYVAGDTSLVIVDYELRYSDESGEPVTVRGTCTDVLRRQPDGNWLMAIDRPVADALPDGMPG